MKRAEKLAKKADELSQAMPPGTPVRYWRGARTDPPKTGSINRSFAAVAYNVVGWVDNYPAFIPASHIEPI